MSRNKLGLFSDCTFAGAFVDAMEVATKADRHGRKPLPEKPGAPPVNRKRRGTRPIHVTLRPTVLARGLGAAAIVLGAGLVVTWLA